MDIEDKPASGENHSPEKKPPVSAPGAGGDADSMAKNGADQPAEDAAKDEPASSKEDSADDSMNADDSVEDGGVKSKDETKGEEETEEDEEEEKEPPVPLLERPPQMSGRRERKTVERFVQQVREENKRGAHVLEEGTGEKLGDCPVICHNIATGKQDDVHTLHQIIFGRPGRPYEFRRNLRAFRGFAFREGDPGFVKKRENLEKYRLDVLRSLAKILDLDKKSGSREEMSLYILQFLCDPKPSGREVKPKKKRRRKSKGGAGSAKKPKKAKSSGDAPADDSDSDDDGDDDDEDGDETKEGDESKEDGEEEKPKTPKKKTDKTPKKTPVKRTPKEKKEKKEKTPGKASAKKATPKSTPKKRKKADAEAGAGSSSEDDEPLVKKSKAKKPPTDNDIKALVRKLLAGANLEEVTMKNILTKVYAQYPEHDLTARKDFIKGTVKALIS